MKKGDCINGYSILADFSTAGGGLSKWTFASKGGREFFIKEFLSPTYPTEDAPGSSKTKKAKRERCEEFEKHHRSLREAVTSSCSHGGNLIFTIDFFREGTKYYKVTEKVDVSGLSLRDIAALPLEQKLLILKTVAHSLNILHQLNIVHGDLKPDNVLIKGTGDGFFTAKLIDFDNSFFAARPPKVAEEVVGDMVYYSPELALYIMEDARACAENLTAASDIFALGLMFSQYLTGNLPLFDRKSYQYAYASALEGHLLRVPESGLPAALTTLIQSMLSANPKDRPAIREVFSRLKAVGVPPVEAEGTGAGLKGSLLNKKPVEKVSGLRGSLINRK